MLLYHPAFDLYHGIFRCLQILHGLQITRIERERLRVYDFYLLFPLEITTITNLPQLLAKERNKFENYKQHEEISNPAAVFYQLELTFENSLKAMRDFGILSEEPTTGWLKVDSSKIPQDLAQSVISRTEEVAEIIDFFRNVLQAIPLTGVDGLKQKTHLLPYRYDRK